MLMSALLSNSGRRREIAETTISPRFSGNTSCARTWITLGFRFAIEEQCRRLVEQCLRECKVTLDARDHGCR